MTSGANPLSTPLDQTTLEAFQATYEALTSMEMALNTLVYGQDPEKLQACLGAVSLALQLLRNVDQRISPRPKLP